MSGTGPHLSLPETARDAMREPLGPIILESDLVLHVRRSDTIITVGDMVTITLVNAGYQVALALFDYRTKRSENSDFKERLAMLQGDRARARNPPATITKELWTGLETAMLKVNTGGRVLLEIEGEEDLGALPAILMAPEGARVLYGMPDRGIVVVTVDKRSRRAAKLLLDLMEPQEGWDIPAGRPVPD